MGNSGRYWRHFLFVGALELLIGGSAFSQVGKWVIVDSTDSQFNLEISCADSLNCMILKSDPGSSRSAWIVKSTDGGKTWGKIYAEYAYIWIDSLGEVRRPDYPGNFFDIKYTSANTAYVVTDSAKVIRTTDGGTTWKVIPIGNPYYSDRMVLAMANDSLGIARYDTGVVITYDGWNTFHRMHIPDTLDYVSRLAAFEHTLWVSFSRSGGIYRIARTSDSGLTWHVTVLPEIARSIFFLDTLRGWMAMRGITGIGSNEVDRIMVTTDGGNTWEMQLDSLIEPTFGLNDIEFVNQDIGAAVGYGGKILRTTNGGRNWTKDLSGRERSSIANFWRVTFVNPTTPLLINRNGTIMRYEPISTAIMYQEPSLLAKAYPNPSNAYVTIEFMQIVSSFTNVKMFNQLGEQVYFGDLGFVPNGIREIHIPVANIRPGNYSCVLQAGPFSKLLSVTLVR